MKKVIVIIVSVLVFAISCNTKNNKVKDIKFPDNSEIVGLGSPVKLYPDFTVINLEYYFPDASVVDSALIEGEKRTRILNRLKRVGVEPDSLSKKISVMKVWAKGFEYTILLKKSEKVKQKISFDPKGKDYKTVQMKGEMNAWNPANTPLSLKNGIWEAYFFSEPGKYQYVFVIDGKEKTDPANKDSISNGMGGFNSLVTVGKLNSNKKTKLFTILQNKNTFSIGYDNKPSRIVVLYQNFQIDNEYVKEDGDKYVISIPEDAKKHKRTFIRVYACNESGYSNDLLIPVEKGNVLTNTSQITRTDFEAATIYNTFVDRFFDGNKNNNRPTKDKQVLPKANFHGGDIAGITKKIEVGYFKNLGINTLWVSPIVKNPEGAYGNYPKPKTKFSAYHGYWPISFTLIDDRFGTEEEFKKLVETAHKNNLNVILDFVANHVHQEHPIYKQHPDWATNLHLPDGSLNTERWDDHRLTTWFDVFLPTLDLQKPEVYNMLSDSAVYWIKKYNLDGFRHDATKHIPSIFWQTLTRKLKKQIVIPEKRRIYQIGETYGSPELIASYVNTGQLDAQFDFNVYDAIVSTLASGSTFKNLARVIKTSQKYYGSHHLMGNITGNQDRGRFISYAGGSLKFDEDAKLAGWTRKIGIGNTEVAYKKAAMLNAIISTIPGIPVIFYGDEIGIPGGNDPDNRKMMRFKNLNKDEQNLKDITTKLLHIHTSSTSLIYGDFKIIKAEKDIFVFERKYFDKVSYVVINNSSEAQTFNIKVSKNIDMKNIVSKFGNKLKLQGNNIEATVAPLSFEIISNE